VAKHFFGPEAVQKAPWVCAQNQRILAPRFTARLPLAGALLAQWVRRCKRANEPSKFCLLVKKHIFAM
jgi:hypothetical protein